VTLEEIRESGKPMLTPADVAEAMGCDPQFIRVQAHRDPAMLGFPVCVIGSRVKIPREGFLNWYEGKGKTA